MSSRSKSSEKFVKTQQTLVTILARVLVFKKKVVQKQTVVALGQGDISGNMKELQPLISTKSFAKMQSSTSVHVMNEFRTSKLCLLCGETLDQDTKSRGKNCNNSTTCIRTIWNRDANAVINILKIF